MKTRFWRNVLPALGLLIILSVINFSCQKNVAERIGKGFDDDNPTPESIMAHADSAIAPYNLNAILVGDHRLGFLEFRQNPDTARVVNLYTWVFNLKPNHTYLFQRAVNPITDSTHCSSTAWLTLGLGLTPQAIHTNKWGYAYQPLWRNVTSIARGTAFYIHFQIIDSATSEPVLRSDCNTYEIR